MNKNNDELFANFVNNQFRPKNFSSEYILIIPNRYEYKGKIIITRYFIKDKTPNESRHLSCYDKIFD